MTAIAIRTRAARGWAGAALRILEFVAYPALAGAAFFLLCLGVVTWLPALTALAESLRRWRSDGDARPFTAVFAAFPHCWRVLWRHGLVSTAAVALLVVNTMFLASQGSLPAFGLLGAQLGIGAALIPYHYALAAVVVGAPELTPAAWRRHALVLAFGDLRRGLGLLAAAVLVPLVTVPIPLGPLLLGASLPMLLALRCQSHQRKTPKKGSP